MVLSISSADGQHAADFHNKHHGVLDHPARIELAECIDQSLAHDPRVPEALLLHNARRGFLSAMLVVLRWQSRRKRKALPKTTLNPNELQPAPEN